MEPSEGQAGSVSLGSEGLRAASVGLLRRRWQRGSRGHWALGSGFPFQDPHSRMLWGFSKVNMALHVTLFLR